MCFFLSFRSFNCCYKLKHTHINKSHVWIEQKLVKLLLAEGIGLSIQAVMI